LLGLDGEIAKNRRDRYVLERQRSDARAEFTGRRRDWSYDDEQVVRRYTEAWRHGTLPQLEPPPEHLRGRIDAAIAALASPEALERERVAVRENAMRAGYSVVPDASRIV